MHSWIHYKDFCRTMKNSGGQFFSPSSHNFFQLIMREDCHHQICTWEVQWKDQELLDPAILAASVDSRMESKCKPPKSRLLLQGNSGVLAGREAQADRTLRWIKQGMRKTQTPQEELPRCSKLSENCCVPCPAPRHPEPPWQWKWSDCTSSKMSSHSPLLKIFL